MAVMERRPRRRVDVLPVARAAGEEARDDGVPRVLLLPYALDRAVVCVEQPSPDAEVAAEYWRARLDGCDGADAALAVGRVAEL